MKQVYFVAATVRIAMIRETGNLKVSATGRELDWGRAVDKRELDIHN